MPQIDKRLVENNYKLGKSCASCTFGLPSGERSEDFTNIWCTTHHGEVQGRMLCDKYK